MARVRFVVVISGVDFLELTVVGWGYKDQGGASHRVIAEKYGIADGEKIVSKYRGRVYAGYLETTLDDKVRVTEGASESMWIKRSHEMDVFIASLLSQTGKAALFARNVVELETDCCF